MPLLKFARTLVVAAALFSTVSVSMPAESQSNAERGFLGMQVQGLSGRISEALGFSKTSGVLVRDVSLDGPASNAGVRRGDLIVQMDGTVIDTFDRLLQVSGKFKAGADVSLQVLRLGERIDLKITLSDWPEGWKVDETAFAAQPELGLTLASITPQLRKRMAIRWGTTGVVVTVFNEQFAGVTPLRRGDVVVQVNQQNIWHPKQFLEAYEAAKSQNRTSMLVLVERPDGFKYILQPIVYNAGAEAPVFKFPGQGG